MERQVSVCPDSTSSFKAILEGLKDVQETQSVKSNSKSKENRFNSFSQRDNDYGELESLLLNSTI